MVQRLQQGGMPTLDISGLEPAQVGQASTACLFRGPASAVQGVACSCCMLGCMQAAHW